MKVRVNIQRLKDDLYNIYLYYKLIDSEEYKTLFEANEELKKQANELYRKVFHFNLICYQRYKFLDYRQNEIVRWDHIDLQKGLYTTAVIGAEGVSGTEVLNFIKEIFGISCDCIEFLI